MYNDLDVNNLRLEVATLLEPIENVQVRNPCKGKFKITVAMPNAEDAIDTISSSNIINRSRGSLGSSRLTSVEYVELIIPESIKIFLTADQPIIPEGTKFIIGYAGANPNDARILSLYGMEQLSGILYTFYESQLKFIQLTMRIEILEKMHNIKYLGPSIGGEK